ncbi:DUF1735 domain-containing protein [Mucilaginibacter terrae]|uniref:DUF1735 domain-containing protein n=1 Tax=Mucilaginibacter terrae TaxID=1955052 RepID=UPI00362F15CD
MKKIIKSLTLLLTVAVLFSSCLKSETIIGPDSPGSVGAIIEFDNPEFIAASSGSVAVPLSRYEFLTLKTGNKVHIDVQYSGTGKPAPSDISVGITTDPTALTAHLSTAQANKPTFVPLPAGLVTLPTAVTIPSGQIKAGFDITITDQFVANTTYAVALKIASASAGTISGNFGTIVVALKRVP